MSELRTTKKELISAQELMLYTPKHTWALVTPEGNIRVGLTDYAQRHLKGIAHVMTDPVGRETRQMEPFGVAETWMFMFDLYSPISGKIVKVNDKPRDEPNIVNTDPYGEGWIIEIKPISEVLEQELTCLLGATEYRKLQLRGEKNG